MYKDINRSVSDTSPGEEMAVGLPWWHDCIHTPFDLARSPLRTRKVCVGGGCVSRAGVVPTGYFQSGRKVGPKEVKMASGS